VLNLDSCGKLPHIVDMSTSIRLSDELVDLAKSTGKIQHRSPPQQIEHWALLGRLLESALSYSTTEAAMQPATIEALDRALAAVDTEAGVEAAHAAIADSSTRIVSRD
jgi:hypothetical protein